MNDLNKELELIEKLTTLYMKNLQSFEAEILDIQLLSNRKIKAIDKKRAEVEENLEDQKISISKKKKQQLYIHEKNEERIDYLINQVAIKNKIEIEDNHYDLKNLNEVEIESIELLASRINDHSIRSKILRSKIKDGYYKHEEMLHDFFMYAKKYKSQLKKIREDEDFSIISDMTTMEEEYQRDIEQISEGSKKELSLCQKAKDECLAKYNNSLCEQLKIIKDTKVFQETFKVFPETKIKIGHYQLQRATDSIYAKQILEEDKQNIVAYNDGSTYLNYNLPVYINLLEDFIFSLDFDSMHCETAELLIQEILLFFMEEKRLGDFEITYIDFYEKAADLGDLLNLNGLPENKPIFDIITTKDKALKYLHDIETYIESVIKTIIGYNDIYEFNKNSSKKIPNKVIVINHFGVNFDTQLHEKVSVILNNLRRCGIHMIFINQSDIPCLIPNSVTSLIEKNNSILSIKGDNNISFCMKQIVLKKLDASIIRNRVQELVEVLGSLKITNEYNNLIKEDISNNSVVDGLSIPFAMDDSGEMINLEIGSDISTHILLSGIIGSGKSNTLHTIILGILNNYSPENIDLWLIDYKKVEFKKYLKNPPQHVKVIGLDRSQQFSYSIIDELYKEYENRLDIFQENNVENLKALINKGVKMTRIVIIIDEFHNLTQAIQNDPTYSLKLENLLSESRAAGISFVFSDQAITVGLKGFSEKSKNQVATRLVMNNTAYEVKEALALPSRVGDEIMKDSFKTLKQGEVLLKQACKKSETGISLGKYKVLHTTDEDINFIINKVNSSYDIHKDMIVSQGQDSKKCDWNVIDKYEKTHDIGSKTIPLYLGTPSSLEPCFWVPLRKELDGNVLVVSNNESILAGIVLQTIGSFLRQPSAKIVICVDEDDENFEMVQSYLKDDWNIEIYSGYSAICNHIKESINSDMKDTIMTIWFGLEMMCEEFKSFSSKQDEVRNIKLDDIDRMQDKINNMAVYMNIDLANAKVEEVIKDAQGSTYNALDDLNRLLSRGPKRSHFSLMLFESVRVVNKINGLKIDKSIHKIGSKMSLDDASSFLTRGIEKEFDDYNAIYNDGSSHYHVFRPYMVEER